MFDRLITWWNCGVDPRAELGAETLHRVERLGQQWQAAMAVMRASPAHKQSFTVPWYLVVGPVGAGKTTLLSNAGLGLDPIITTSSDADTKAKADDEAFTLWLGENAVFIEVSGRLLNDGEAQHDWRTLLWLINRERRHLPLRGVFIVKPLAEQFRRTPTENAADATLTRDRLQVLAAVTGTVVPTYVVITKADLLGGFKEFFAHSDANVREQVLGLTLPWPPERDPVHAVTVAYERLLDRLRDRRLLALGATSVETAQRKLMQFPAQLRTALPYLTDYLAIAARPSQDGQPTLRSVCLTSVLPPPRHLPPAVTSDDADAALPKSLFFAVPAATAPGTVRPAPPATPAPVPAVDRPLVSFIHELFTRVVQVDATLAAMTAAAHQRWRQMRMACLVVIPLVVAALVAVNVWSTWCGLTLIEALRQPQAALRENQRRSPSDTTTHLLAIDQLGTALGAALAHHGPGLGKAGEAAGEQYVRALRPLLLDACLQGMRAELAALRHGATPAPVGGHGGDDLLRAYQMLGGMLDAQPAVITRTLLDERRWFRGVDPVGGGTCEFRIEALARQQLDLCVATLLPAGLLRLDIDRPLVDAVHQEIGDRLLIDQAYGELIQHLTPQFGVVAPATLLSEPQYSALGAATNVSLLYSQEAWDGTVARAIEERTDDLMVALEKLALPHDRATVVSRLRQRFVDDHQRRWLAVIASMRAAQVRDFRDTAGQIDRLSGEESPVPRFITGALTHLRLNVADTTTRGATDSTWVKPCLQAISSLRSDVIDYQQAMAFAKRSTDVERLRTLVGRFNAVSARIGDVIAQVEPPATRTAIQAGFDGLLRSLVADLDRNHVEEIDRVWSEQVFQTFDAHLAKRFPFAGNAAEEVPLVEFAAFFNPNGTLWTVLAQLETMRDITVLGRPAVTLDDDYARVLRTAQDLRALFFVGSSPTLHLRFGYRMQQREHVRDLRVQFGATTNTLYERPDARYLVELTHGGTSGARISLQTVGGEWKHREETGEWAFLRLLRAGQPKSGSAGDLVCTWEHEALVADKSQTLKATLVLDPGNIATAVNGNLLSGLVLPRRIVRLDAGR